MQRIMTTNERLSGWIILLLSCSAIAARCAPRVEIAEGEGGEGGEEPASGATTSGGASNAGRAGEGAAGKPSPSFGGNGASAGGGGAAAGMAGDTSGGTGEPRGVCTPGADQTCNDNLAASALWGKCEADGTCSCNSSFVINPATGKCAPAAPTACSLPKDSGPCADVGVPHYYFDVATGACEKFTVHCGGRPRNANAFETLGECEAACVSPACEVPFVDGVCEALIPIFSYNASTGICEPRTYGGCGGTPNRFQSAEDCQAACKTSGGREDATAVIQGRSCVGFGKSITGPADEGSFELDGTVLKRTMSWGCGCPKRPEFVMMYEPSSPIELRLCHDDGADSCEALCSAELGWDLARAFEQAGTDEFVFAK
jgi:hypothetical protein